MRKQLTRNSVKRTNGPAVMGCRVELTYQHQKGEAVKACLRYLFVCAIVLAAILVATQIGPLRSAIEIGGDEHFELAKAFLWAKGYPLYDRIWSDQPPLYTALFGTLFKYFGPTIGVARGLALCFGISLFVACFLIVKERHGFWGAYVAAACLLAAPFVLILSVSVMKEVAAIGTAVWALWPIYRWQASRRTLWLVVSGVLVAAAVQIKFAAAVMVPAFIVELLLTSHSDKAGGARINDRLWNLFVWAGSTVGAFFTITMLLGGSYTQMWQTHLSPGVAQESEAMGLALSPNIVLKHTEAALGAAAGILILVIRREWGRLAFPAVLLSTVIAVHIVHRPWWNSYYLQFALPLAWLTGYSFAELLKTIQAHRVNGCFQRCFASCGSLALAGSVVLLLVAIGLPRFISQVKDIQALPRIEDSALVEKMKEHAKHTKWVYAQSTIFPFLAELPTIPELAVLSSKRFWSGQITGEQRWAIVKKYQPEQLLLQPLLLSEVLPLDMQEFLDQNYTIVFDDGQQRLYVAKSVISKLRKR